MVAEAVLSTYLNDHLLRLSAAAEQTRRAAHAHPDTDRSAELEELAREAEADRDELHEYLDRLGVQPSTAQAVLSKVEEKAAELSPAGMMASRSPMGEVMDLEALRVDVASKACLWQVLRAVAAHDDRLSRERLEVLLERAEDQGTRLYRLHLALAQELLEEALG